MARSPYHKETDTLKGLTGAEHRMIRDLAKSRLPHTERILKNYFEQARNKSRFIERTEIIFSTYQRWGALVLNPFSFKSEIVSKVLELIDHPNSELFSGEAATTTLQDSVAKAAVSKQAKRKKLLLSLENSIKPASRWNTLKQTLIDEGVVGERNELLIKGAGWKRRTIQFIHSLDKKGYFEKRLNSYEVVAIIQNSFGESVSREYVDKVHHLPLTDEFKFIPKSSKSS